MFHFTRRVRKGCLVKVAEEWKAKRRDMAHSLKKFSIKMRNLTKEALPS
jgi:hypothetical protein